MQIRKSVEADMPRLMELSRLFEYSPFAFDKRIQSLCENINPYFAETMLSNPQFMTLVAESDGVVAGYITAAINKGLTPAAGKVIGNILLLAVDKKFRGQGIGEALVDKATAYLCATGAELITVVTDLYNTPAISVYEKCGYRMRMGWHIYRYYRAFGVDDRSLNDSVDIIPLKSIEKFRSGFARPVSLLKDKTVDAVRFRDYLSEQFLGNIRKGKTMPLGYFISGKPVAMLNLAEDEISIKTLSSDKNKVIVYKLLDLIADRGTDIVEAGSILLREATVRLRDFDILELWTDADNDELIETAEKAGYHLSYTGVALHYEKSKN